MNARTRITELIAANQPASTRAIAEAVGCSQQRAHVIVQELIDAGTVRHIPPTPGRYELVRG